MIADQGRATLGDRNAGAARRRENGTGRVQTPAQASRGAASEHLEADPVPLQPAAR